MLAKRGLSQASLMLDWAAIVGPRFAALCEPARLQWPPRGPRSDPEKPTPATLWLRVTPGRGLDVQYQAPALIERVNAHFGWRCVGKVTVAPEAKRRIATAAPVADDDRGAREKAAAVTRPVADDALREALTRLGAGIFARR